MKRYSLLFCMFCCYSALFAQTASLQRSHFDMNVGIGRRAYINSHEGVVKGMASINYVQKINNVFYLKTGLDAMYWDVTYYATTGKGYLLTSTSYEHFAYAWFLGGEIVMNKVVFQGGMSKYLYFKHLSQYDVNYFSKIGFKYLITPRLNVGFFLKAHSYEADYMDFGIGLKL